MANVLSWLWNAIVSRTTQNVVGSGVTLGGILTAVRGMWPDLLPWSAETDVWLVSTGAGILSRLVAFWRTPDKAASETQIKSKAGSGGRPTAALLIVGLSLACWGCATVSAVRQDERAQLLISQKAFASAVDALADAREAGSFTQAEADQITVVVAEIKAYLSEWADAELAGESRPNAYTEFQAMLSKLAELNGGS